MGRKYDRALDRVFTTLKWIILPIVFLAAAVGVVMASVYISFGRPWIKLAGLGLLLAALTAWAVGLWFAFGRPNQWFPPGENSDSKYSGGMPRR